MTQIKLTPLYTVAEQHHAQFIELAGWRVAATYKQVETEVSMARKGVTLADSSPHGKLQIEGASAFSALQAVFGATPETIGSGLPVEAGHLYRLRRDLFYLSTPPGQEHDAQARLEAGIRQADHFVTVTDVTHGLADIRLLGPNSRSVLNKVCALDFHPSQFPNQTAKQTSLAKTKQMLIRRDLGDLLAYQIIGAQSLATYLWEVLLEAGHAYSILPIGVEALRALEQKK